MSEALFLIDKILLIALIVYMGFVLLGDDDE